MRTKNASTQRPAKAKVKKDERTSRVTPVMWAITRMKARTEELRNRRHHQLAKRNENYLCVGHTGQQSAASKG